MFTTKEHKGKLKKLKNTNRAVSIAHIASAAVVGVTLVAAPGVSTAQQRGKDAASYPTRPVRVIVPYSPGGSSDAVARILSAKLAESLGQQFVIDNRPGAAGSMGR